MLRVVPALNEQQPPVIFCGHCGLEPENEAAASLRVCSRCGLGLMLAAARDLAPKPTEAFLIVDNTLAVCALSELAEELLHVDETEGINRHITDFIVPAHAEEPGPHNLLNLLVSAASGEVEMHTAIVRPTTEFGVRYAVRVGACGPPRAALLVLCDDQV